MKVRAALECFKSLHKTDPRPFLNSNFWSVIVIVITDSRSYTDPKYDDWCNEQIGNENWVRIGPKIWFTNQQQYAHFRLAWEDELEKGDPLYAAGIWDHY